MDYRYRIGQDALKFLYATAQERMKTNREYADKHKAVISKQHFFNTEKEALQFAIDKMKNEPCNYQIWAMIEKAGNILRIQERWFVTDDWKVKQAADYVGMALMYDETRLSRIIIENIKVDDVVAYW